MNSEKLNIMFINSIAPNKYGGGEKWMLTAASGLMKKGHSVVIAGKTNSIFLEKAKNLKLKTEEINIKGDFDPIKSFKISKYLKKNKIHVLICNFNKDVRVAGLGARIAKTPLVLARHGLQIIDKRAIHKLTLKYLVDGIITNSNTIKQIYDSYNWFEQDFVKVIFNGVQINDEISAYNYQAEFPGKKIIFSAGRFVEQKGFEYLIQSAEILNLQRQDLVFAIAGEGELENQLKQLVKSKKLENTIKFLGFKNDILPFIKGADIFVLPSLYEGMPNVVMEAMSVAKPVIATNVNGTAELIEENQTGFTIPIKNPQILAEKINLIIDDKEKLIELGLNGKNRVEKLFSIERMITNLENYFYESINKQKA